jgi:hypothetical protein
MTTIILNAESVNALFPEGSEARVQLQNTVLRELSAQFIKNASFMDIVAQEVKPKILAEQDKALAEFGIVKGRMTYSSYTLNDHAKQLVADHVQSGISALLSRQVAALNVQEEVARQVDEIVVRRIRQGVRARLEELQRQNGD